MNIIKLKQDINHKSEERKGIMTVASGQLKPHQESRQPEAKAKKTVISPGYWWAAEGALNKGGWEKVT